MDTGLFKWVWRFNALVIAALTSLVCVLLLYEVTRDLLREQRAPQTVNVDPNDNIVEERLEIGSVSFNEDTGLIEFPILRPQTYNTGGYTSGNSKSTYNNTVNRGYLDPETSETRWLLEHSNGLIVDWHQITRGDSENPTRVAMLLRWITEDTTGDRSLSTSDSGSVYMFEPNGQNLTLLASDIDELAHEFTFDEKTEVVSLVQDGNRELAYLSLPDLMVVKLQALPKLER